MKYSVKSKSPSVLLFPVVTVIGANLAPLEDWTQVALLAIALGAVGGFAGRGLFQRTFEPADASLATKRKAVAIFAIARLVFGFVLILLSVFVFADWLVPTFVALGGYVAGGTIATPMSDRDLAAL
jgi:hypothetical protein